MIDVKEIKFVHEIDPFIEYNRLSMLYISQDDCSVCHAVYPKLKELLSHYPKIKLAHINANQVEAVAGKFLIFTAPVIILFYDQKEYLREGRFVQFEKLRVQLDQLYKAI